MMKRHIGMQLVAVVTFVLGACQQAPPVLDAPQKEESLPMADKPANYQALPGQAATSSTPSETTTAFEFAAASLGISPGSTPVAKPTASPITFTPDPPEKPSAPLGSVVAPSGVPSAPPIPDPRPVQDEPAATPSPASAPKVSNTRRGSAGISAAQSKSAAGDAGYAVQVINGTSGRLFVEAQDDSGNIFPFGFMYAGQRVASHPQTPRPISGKLTIVIRDPDQPGAPELRRYAVRPPENYMGHTLGVTILPGGRYRAAVDGKVYYVTPEQDAPPATGMTNNE